MTRNAFPPHPYAWLRDWIAAHQPEVAYHRPVVREAASGNTAADDRSAKPPGSPLAPRSVRELVRLYELGLLTKGQARRLLGQRPHWWSR